MKRRRLRQPASMTKETARPPARMRPAATLCCGLPVESADEENASPTRALHDIHLHVLKVRQKAPEPPRQKGDARVVVAAYGHPFFLGVRERSEPRLQGLRLKEDSCGGLREDLSRLGHAKPSGTSPKKPGSDTLLQVRQSIARGARGKVYVFGRLRDGPRQSDGGKDAQILYIKVKHGTHFRKFRKYVVKLSDGFQSRGEGKMKTIGRNPMRENFQSRGKFPKRRKCYDHESPYLFAIRRSPSGGSGFCKRGFGYADGKTGEI